MSQNDKNREDPHRRLIKYDGGHLFEVESMKSTISSAGI
jgi:hypothetical protein